jgi:hypothetical protein
MEIEVNYMQCERLRRGVHDWVTDWDWTYPMVVGLTVKQWNVYTGWLSDYALEENVHFFLNRLEASFYGSIQRRKGAKLHAFPVQETSVNKRRHFHLLIDNPLGLIRDDYEWEVRKSWAKTAWGDRELDVEEYDPTHHQLAYSTKLRTKPDYSDAFLWQVARKTI